MAGVDMLCFAAWLRYVRIYINGIVLSNDVCKSFLPFWYLLHFWRSYGILISVMLNIFL